MNAGMATSAIRMATMCISNLFDTSCLFHFPCTIPKKTNNLNPTQKLIFTKLAKIPPLAPTPPSAKFLTGQL